MSKIKSLIRKSPKSDQSAPIAVNSDNKNIDNISVDLSLIHI